MRYAAYFVALDGDYVTVTGHDDVSRRVTSVEDFNYFLLNEQTLLGKDVELQVMFSSSMDFPADYTSNPNTLALVKALGDDTMQ